MDPIIMRHHADARISQLHRDAARLRVGGRGRGSNGVSAMRDGVGRGLIRLGERLVPVPVPRPTRVSHQLP
jgi:hypothetical protein